MGINYNQLLQRLINKYTTKSPEFGGIKNQARISPASKIRPNRGTMCPPFEIINPLHNSQSPTNFLGRMGISKFSHNSHNSHSSHNSHFLFKELAVDLGNTPPKINH